MSSTFHGSYTVAVTPFNDDGSGICTDSLKAFLDWQINCGVPGVILLGSTGEFLTITEDERHLLVETAVGHVNGRMNVLIGRSRDAFSQINDYIKTKEGSLRAAHEILSGSERHHR